MYLGAISGCMQLSVLDHLVQAAIFLVPVFPVVDASLVVSLGGRCLVELRNVSWPSTHSVRHVASFDVFSHALVIKYVWAYKSQMETQSSH